MLKWYHFIMLFFGGAFLANFFPHFVEGITGDMFPTPFADPPGQGMSSSTVNVLWALGNLAVGYFLLQGGKLSLPNRVTVLVAFIGFAAMAINLSVVFAGVA
jgi:hypothetical protein